MAREVNHEKLMAVFELNEGDKVKLTDGSIAEFVRLKQKKFIGIINGTPYDISVNAFDEVVEKVDLKAKLKKQEQEYKSLQRNELFFINHNGDAKLYRFNEVKNGRIIGMNPVTNTRAKIDPSLFGGKVSNL